jgi:hypothetical protein
VFGASTIRIPPTVLKSGVVPAASRPMMFERIEVPDAVAPLTSIASA